MVTRCHTFPQDIFLICRHNLVMFVQVRSFLIISYFDTAITAGLGLRCKHRRNIRTEDCQLQFLIAGHCNFTSPEITRISGKWRITIGVIEGAQDCCLQDSIMNGMLVNCLSFADGKGSGNAGSLSFLITVQLGILRPKPFGL